MSGTVDHPSDDDGLLVETRQRILEGALEGIGRLGPKRTTMSDVAEFAGVSRGTVYRYFESRDALFVALVEYEGDRFERMANARLEHAAPGSERLAALTSFIVSYLDQHPALTQLFEISPRYVVDFLREHMETFRRVMLITTEPLFAQTPLARSGELRVEAMNELLLRLLISYFLLPKTNAEESLEALGVILRSLAVVDRAPSRTESKGPGAVAGDPDQSLTARDNCHGAPIESRQGP